MSISVVPCFFKNIIMGMSKYFYYMILSSYISGFLVVRFVVNISQHSKTSLFINFFFYSIVVGILNGIFWDWMEKRDAGKIDPE